MKPSNWRLGIVLILFTLSQHTIHALQSSDEAYVTLLYGDEFLLGVRVLGKSIRDTRSTKDMVALVSDGVSDYAKNLLQADGWIVKLISLLANPNQVRPKRFWGVYTKLKIFNMTDYKKVVYLDADTIVVKSIEDLFKCGKFCANLKHSERLNSGVMVVEPSQAVFNDMMSQVKTLRSYTGGDQGFLNSYYAGFPNAHVFEPDLPQHVLNSRTVPDMERLSTLYNADVGLYMLANKWMVDEDLLRVIHYTLGPLKPWDWWTSWLLKPVDVWQNVREQLQESLPGTGGGRNPNDELLVKLLFLLPLFALLFCYYRYFLQTRSFCDHIRHLSYIFRSTGAAYSVVSSTANSNQQFSNGAQSKVPAFLGGLSVSVCLVAAVVSLALALMIVPRQVMPWTGLLLMYEWTFKIFFFLFGSYLYLIYQWGKMKANQVGSFSSRPGSLDDEKETVFAYGQTNSGKTHTMRGSTSEPGVIPHAVRDLFDSIQEDMDREFLLRMSYMEIYNEEINDLLAPEHRKLQIHESLERGIFVAGLKEEIVASPEQILGLMEFGESHRHIGETNMNLYSSRSHTIFRMIIESKERSEDEDSGSSCDAVRVSVLNLVDLAGSERAAKTGAEGVRLKEGSHINKSLMTLGTVIKKLSEGAESQGGHVPYRDSKLTRILQPALGGNANTAIICNITLAQIHADETKSSLQFASRALRVTNCARVNEILTDAALLKRQKKEIEELRAKLQGSHSEHFEEEILNLRNTLLQTELERERIAMELEEEKKAQAEREKRLQEQAKKIENLSSMVLYSNRDENRDQPKKGKRRDTWCFGNLSRETLGELNSIVHAKASAVKPMRSERDMGPLLPFEELVDDASMDNPCKPKEECNNNTVEDCTLPDSRALLHVTNRKKAPLRKKSLLVENNELEELQAEYEDLLLKFETQKIMSEIEVDSLTRKLAEADLCLHEKCNAYSTYHLDKSTIHRDATKSLRESEAILVIKQLQEKINMLEVEKSSSQQNLDCVVELATEQNICATEKYEELYEELLNAREEARIACEQLTSVESVRTIDEDNFDSTIKLLLEVQEITSEVQNSRNLAESVSLIVDELFQSFSAILNLFTDFKSLACDNSMQLKSIISNHERLNHCMKHKVNELENEKLLLHNQSVDLHSQIQELSQKVQDSDKALSELSEQHDLEKSELLSQIRTLEKEISCLSSSSLAREKEILRKDLEKTKTKLRETESKLKNAIQEKTKLEGEKACAERELKKLHAQKSLQRDISKRESLAGRKRDSIIDRSSNVFDPRRAKGLSVSYDQTFQDEYKKLEVLAFEMETTIASLEEELTTANEEKEMAISRSESLASDLQALSDNLNMSNSKMNTLEEEISDLRSHLEKSTSYNQELESSKNMLVEEKEELAMQLTEALLAMEEEKAIWSAKEKASIEAIEEKGRLYNAETMFLSEGISEVRNELASCREECKVLQERLTCSEENVKLEKNCSMEKSLENDRLRNELKVADEQCKKSVEDLKSKLQMLASEHHHACVEVEKLQMELSVLNEEKEDLLNQVRDLHKGSVLIDDFQVSSWLYTKYQ